MIRLFAHMYVHIYIYMFAIAGQTAEPNLLRFFLIPRKRRAPLLESVA